MISTPIGNIEDITYRAIRILQECNVIFCEDTRRTGKLLSHYKIKNKLDTYNDINKKRRTPIIVELLKNGNDIALVSDSGTPGINDPGFYLIRECINQNIDIVPIPGPSSILAGLVCSGLPTDKFTFLGFIPKTSGKRLKLIESLKEKDETIILLESPHRIQKTLKAMSETIPEKNIVIARELTKKFEEFIRGSVLEVYEKIKDRTIKGEIVLVVN
ncbi:16S rRNA (cytidine(1402)-2'-O)-methyltransferase [archaeon]|nr:16S rRNA (cytidine(1402)-2'-O)-methyltransferase [archaeon]MBT4352617.1 16S rRNA (cytidine(1402)-2'-O)-methyltransferase [archaeon]MBT4648248.1 16S rRNA (cytidine(1402)-2'-O)-methyltransferase [archaeon]MBT6820871.1 16S rRNA (cytidine(1402)-2'-O)-methyltransferase [archaeon]MBT7392724.1 16S rRNA (cytidine(1402)-2'-O)-methyltransferase [archaeon]